MKKTLLSLPLIRAFSLSSCKQISFDALCLRSMHHIVERNLIALKCFGSGLNRASQGSMTAGRKYSWLMPIVDLETARTNTLVTMMLRPLRSRARHFVNLWLRMTLFIPASFATCHNGPSGTWCHPNGTWTRNDIIGVAMTWPLISCRSWDRHPN